MCDELFILDRTIRIINGKRYYEMPLSKTNKANANKTFPIIIKINDIVFKTNSWSDLFINTINYLLTSCDSKYRYHIYNNLYINNMPLFIKTPHVGYKRMNNNIYILINISENEMYEILISMLAFFEIKNTPHLLVYRYPVAENKCIKEYITNKNKELYEKYLNCIYSNGLVKEIIRKINVVDEVFSRFSLYVSLFLFDNYDIFIYEIERFFNAIEGLYADSHLLLFKENVTKYLIPYYKQVNLY